MIVLCQNSKGVSSLKTSAIRRICVFCGSNAGDRPVYTEQAKALGKLMGERHIELVYGGGHVGIMGIVADAVLKNGGRVTGIIPHALAERELAHEGLSRLEVVRTMHERKKRMFDLSDAFIMFPGGFGTLDETFEIITWQQIGIHRKPVVILNIDGFYTPLLEFIEHARTEGFIMDKGQGFFEVAESPEKAVELLAAKFALNSQMTHK